MRKSTILDIILVIGLSFLCHWMLVPNGFEAVHADYAPTYLVANDFRDWHWTAFIYDMSYAGTSFEPLRALWAAVWEHLSHSPLNYVESHLAYTYLVNPALLSIGIYILSRAYFSRGASLMAGLTAAIGLAFHVPNAPNDTYAAMLLFGCLILAARAKYPRPFQEMSVPVFFVAGGFAGFSLYTSRACIFYVLPFLFTWNQVKTETLSLFAPRDRSERILFSGMLACLILFLYLYLFGTNLGTVAGHTLKLDADPNLKFSFIFGLILWTKKNYERVQKWPWPKIIFFGAGGVIGMLPEIIHNLPEGHLFSNTRVYTVDFVESMSAVASLPAAFSEIVRGGNTLASNASILLFLGGLMLLGWRARKDERLRPLLFSALLTFLVWCRYETYIFKSPRYLLPTFPALFVGIACAWDWALRRSRGWIFGLVVLTCLHATTHLQDRLELSHAFAEGKRFSEATEAIQIFRSQGVRSVLSDDYWWYSHSYTFLSRENPVFEPPQGPGALRPNRMSDLSEQRQVGIFVDATNHPSSIQQLKMLGSEWRLKFLGHIGSRNLFLGTRL